MGCTLGTVDSRQRACRGCRLLLVLRSTNDALAVGVKTGFDELFREAKMLVLSAMEKLEPGPATPQPIGVDHFGVHLVLAYFVTVHSQLRTSYSYVLDRFAALPNLARRESKRLEGPTPTLHDRIRTRPRSGPS